MHLLNSGSLKSLNGARASGTLAKSVAANTPILAPKMDLRSSRSSRTDLWPSGQLSFFITD